MQIQNTKDLEQELSACDEVEQYLNENDRLMRDTSVSDYLTRLLRLRGLRRMDVIRASGLNDIYAHQIFSGRREPSRDKLLCLCFGMKLSAKETQDLLKHCGYPVLYARHRRDSVILHALFHQMSLLQCSETLDSIGEAPLY